MSLFGKKNPKLVVPKKDKKFGNKRKSKITQVVEEDLEEQDNFEYDIEKYIEQEEEAPVKKPKVVKPPKMKATSVGSGVTKPVKATPKKPVSKKERPVKETPSSKTTKKSTPTNEGRPKSKPKSFEPPKMEKPSKGQRGSLGSKKDNIYRPPKPPKETTVKTKKSKKSLFNKKTVSETVVAGLSMSEIIIPNTLAYSSDYAKNTGYPVNKEVVDISKVSSVEPITQLFTKEVESVIPIMESTLNIVDVEESDLLSSVETTTPQQPLTEKPDTVTELLEPEEEPVVKPIFLQDEEDGEDELQLESKQPSPVKEGGIDDLDDITFDGEVEHSASGTLDMMNLDLKLEGNIETPIVTPIPVPVEVTSGVPISEPPVPEGLNLIDDNLDIQEGLQIDNQPLTEQEDTLFDPDDDLVLDEEEVDLEEESFDLKSEVSIEPPTETESLDFHQVEEPSVTDSLSFEPVEMTKPQELPQDKLVLGGENKPADNSSDILQSSTFNLDEFKKRINTTKEEDDLLLEVVEREKEIASIRAVADLEKQIQNTASLVDALKLAKGEING